MAVVVEEGQGGSWGLWVAKESFNNARSYQWHHRGIYQYEGARSRQRSWLMEGIEKGFGSFGERESSWSTAGNLWMGIKISRSDQGVCMAIGVLGSGTSPSITSLHTATYYDLHIPPFSGTKIEEKPII